MATTRRQNQKNTLNTKQSIHILSENSGNVPIAKKPSIIQDTKKRAFGDITNAVHNLENVNKKTKKTQKGGKKKTIAIPTEVPAPTLSQPEKMETQWDIVELSSQESLASSQESLTSSQNSHQESFTCSQSSNSSHSSQSSNSSQASVLLQDWVDVDKEHMNDPHQVGLYVSDIFNYYRQREVKFEICDYMKTQTDLSTNMRAILVDWLVEVQENFELNHETLYLAVKMVDRYLSRKSCIQREKLQLLGATCLFIACKFDERCPPVLDDFLYICDDAYQRQELINMEMEVLRTLDYDLGMPLSYRFLRRNARVCKASMEVLTLGRYILEMSLMDYNIIQQKDSKVAAASLLLASLMKGQDVWDRTLVHYSGYEKSDLAATTLQLNTLISAPRAKNLKTILSKYSHKVFHEVALIPSLTESQVTELQSCSTPHEAMELS